MNVFTYCRIRWYCFCLQFPLSADVSPMPLPHEIDSRYQAWIQNVKFSSIVWRNERHRIQIKIRCVKACERKRIHSHWRSVFLSHLSYVVAARLPLSSTPQDENMCNSGKLILFLLLKYALKVRGTKRKWSIVWSGRIYLPNQVCSHPVIVGWSRGMLYFLTLLSKERSWSLIHQFLFVW